MYVCDVQTNNNNADDAGEIRDWESCMWAKVGVRALSRSLLRSDFMYRDSTTFIIIFLLFFIAAF